jgi:calcineurin-like phosphoesterase family protein
MSVWFTADTHLGHGNIIKYCLRPFLTAKERELAERDARNSPKLSPETIRRHDEAILDAINSRVQPDDTLWVLGDFCWGGRSHAQGYRDQIRCQHVHLVWGNHDAPDVGGVFGRTMEQGMIRVEGQDIWLNHYPMRSWHKAFHGSWHLYGHVHGKLMGEDTRVGWRLTRDVGVDACEYRPLSFANLREYMQPRLLAFEEHKAAMLSGATDSAL